MSDLNRQAYIERAMKHAKFKTEFEEAAFVMVISLAYQAGWDDGVRSERDKRQPRKIDEYDPHTIE